MSCLPQPVRNIHSTIKYLQYIYHVMMCHDLLAIDMYCKLPCMVNLLQQAAGCTLAAGMVIVCT